MRINAHPILEFKRGPAFFFQFDGVPILAYPGETIAASLCAAGIISFGRSRVKKRTRGLFCAIGNCASCKMVVDGVPNVKTCVTLVKEGMEVKTQTDRGWL